MEKRPEDAYKLAAMLSNVPRRRWDRVADLLGYAKASSAHRVALAFAYRYGLSWPPGSDGPPPVSRMRVEPAPPQDEPMEMDPPSHSRILEPLNLSPHPAAEFYYGVEE